MTKKAFVIGYPIKHSLSPVLHGYWLDKLGIDGSYEAIEIAPENLDSELKRLQQEGYVGGNVTIPHKEAVFALCDEKMDEAIVCNAANTLIFGDKITGYNSDWIGFKNNIEPSLKAKETVLLIGAGGSARAVLLALLKMGFENILIANRSPEKAEQLATDIVIDEPAHKTWHNKGQKVSVEILPLDELELAGQPDLIVNTTSLGMAEQGELLVPDSILGENTVVTDLVYNPLETPLLKQARSKGLLAVDGLGMLIHQAVMGFELWFGQTPPIDGSEKQHLIEHLNNGR